MPLPANWPALFEAPMTRADPTDKNQERMLREQQQRWRRAIGDGPVDRLVSDTAAAIEALASAAPAVRVTAASILANSPGFDLNIEAAVRTALGSEQESNTAMSLACSYSSILARTRLFPFAFSLSFLSLLPQLSASDEAKLFFGALLGYYSHPKCSNLRMHFSQPPSSLSGEHVDLRSGMVCYFGNPDCPNKPARQVANQIAEMTNLCLATQRPPHEHPISEAGELQSTSSWHCLAARAALFVPDVALAIQCTTNAITIDPEYSRLYYERALYYYLENRQAEYEADMWSARKYRYYPI
jgi:hypothetical protein